MTDVKRGVTESWTVEKPPRDLVQCPFCNAPLEDSHPFGESYCPRCGASLRYFDGEIAEAHLSMSVLDKPPVIGDPK